MSFYKQLYACNDGSWVVYVADFTLETLQVVLAAPVLNCIVFIPQCIVIRLCGYGSTNLRSATYQAGPSRSVS